MLIFIFKIYYNPKLLFSLLIIKKIREYIRIYRDLLRNTLKNIKIYKIISFIKVYNSILFIKLVLSNYKIIRSVYRTIDTLILYYYYKYTSMQCIKAKAKLNSIEIDNTNIDYKACKITRSKRIVSRDKQVKTKDLSIFQHADI